MRLRKRGETNVPLKGIMSRDVVRVGSDMPFDKIKETFFKEDVSIIIVEENGEMIGVITPSDVVSLLHA